MVNFSSANLALVAYVSVDGDGTSPDMNSGVKTTKLQTGVYDIILPGDPTQQSSLQEEQESARTMLSVTVKGSPTVGAVANHISSRIKRVETFNTSNTNPTSSAFDMFILRTVISPPLNTNG